MVLLPGNTLRSPFLLLFSLTSVPVFGDSGGLIVSKYGSAEAVPFIIGILALGVLSGLLVYNLFLAITTRERMFAYFSAIMLLLSVLQSFSTFERFFFYLTYNRVTLITHTLFIIFLLFFQDFFQIPRQNRSLSSWNRISIPVIAGYTLLFLLLKALTPEAAGLHAGLDFIRELFVFYTNALFITNIILAMKWMKTEAIMILVAFIPPALLTSLNAMNIFPFMEKYGSFTSIMMQYNQPIGLSLQAILLSLAVGNRYNRVNTERRIAADERDRLKTLDREKTEYYLNLSHELRTPLTIILGLTEQLKEGKYGDSIQKNRKTFEMLERNGLRLLRQIEAMLRIESPREETRSEFLPLNDQMQAYVDEFAPIAREKGLQLVYSISDDLKSTYLQMSTEDCDSLVLNLISNAIKYTPPGGRISLEISATEDLRIAVRDTGPGVPPEYRDVIFDPFRRCVDGRGGTGLGLYMVKNIMSSSGGKVSLEENDNGGCVFILSFPKERLTRHYRGTSALSSRQNFDMYTAEFDRSSLEKESTDPGCPVLLIVEDDQDMIEYLASILSQNYRLFTAVGGKAALEILKDETVDMIISDVMMKPMDGHEFYQKFRSAFQNSTVPFLFLTARNSVEEKIKSLKDGAAHYIAKPFNSEELLALVEATLTRQRHLLTNNISSIRKEIDSLLDNLDTKAQGKPAQGLDMKKVMTDYSLSAREAEVLSCILKGLPDKEISRALNLSPSTVANHNRRLYQKLGVKSRLEAVACFLNISIPD
ncbi:MAG: response regulator [Spirochaetales bacterium]|nr:response regulator [Spirochaetales bacterium]